MKRYCLALDLKNNPNLIKQYIAHHQEVWPEVKAGFVATGILSVNLYKVENRLCMLLETTDEFSFEAKATYDQNQPKIQAWEQLMEQFQKRLPNTPKDVKWRQMEMIFSFQSTHNTN